MHVVGLSVSVASRAWDGQHDDLVAAADQVGAAPTAGFTPGVSGAAARFALTWQRGTSLLADQATVHADGLRAVIADFLETDEAVGASVLVLRAYLVGAR